MSDKHMNIPRGDSTEAVVALIASPDVMGQWFLGDEQQKVNFIKQFIATWVNYDDDTQQGFATGFYLQLNNMRQSITTLSQLLSWNRSQEAIRHFERKILRAVKARRLHKCSFFLSSVLRAIPESSVSATVFTTLLEELNDLHLPRSINPIISMEQVGGFMEELMVIVSNPAYANIKDSLVFALLSLARESVPGQEKTASNIIYEFTLDLAGLNDSLDVPQYLAGLGGDLDDRLEGAVYALQSGDISES